LTACRTIAGNRLAPATLVLAAALSVRTGRPFHELDAGLVQAELDRQGVRHR
jgi:hypothetical protein